MINLRQARRRPGRVFHVSAMVLGLLGLAVDAAAQSPLKTFSIHDKPKELPEIRFVDGEGKTASLADFRGKLVLLNIWATWCGPCRREMPTLDRLQAKLGGKAFRVVALSIDRAGIDAVRPFYQELGLSNLTIYIDRSAKVTRQLAIVGIPTTLLLDAAGREIGRLTGPAEWDDPAFIDFVRKRLPAGSRSPGGKP